MWDLPVPGHEPVSPALAGGFLTTAPPGKPPGGFLTTAPPGKSYNVVFDSGVQLSDSVISIYLYIFIFRFFSIIRYYKIWTIVPCAI